MNTEEVISAIASALESFDGNSLADLYNNIAMEYGHSIKYVGDNLFKFETQS